MRWEASRRWGKRSCTGSTSRTTSSRGPSHDRSPPPPPPSRYHRRHHQRQRHRRHRHHHHRRRRRRHRHSPHHHPTTSPPPPLRQTTASQALARLAKWHVGREMAPTRSALSCDHRFEHLCACLLVEPEAVDDASLASLVRALRALAVFAPLPVEAQAHAAWAASAARGLLQRRESREGGGGGADKGGTGGAPQSTRTSASASTPSEVVSGLHWACSRLGLGHGVDDGVGDSIYDGVGDGMSKDVMFMEAALRSNAVPFRVMPMMADPTLTGVTLGQVQEEVAFRQDQISTRLVS